MFGTFKHSKFNGVNDGCSVFSGLTGLGEKNERAFFEMVDFDGSNHHIVIFARWDTRQRFFVGFVCRRYPWRSECFFSTDITDINTSH